MPGFGPTAGAAIASHMGIDKVAFTGSTKVRACLEVCIMLEGTGQLVGVLCFFVTVHYLFPNEQTWVQVVFFFQVVCLECQIGGVCTFVPDKLNQMQLNYLKETNTI